MSSAPEVLRQLQSLASPERATHSARFFKTGPGQYAEGDIFLGITVPQIRTVVRQYRDLPTEEVFKLLKSPLHEVRLTALLLLVHQFQRGNPLQQEHIAQCYLDHLDHVNNWDLVDSSADKILGAWLAKNAKIDLLDQLADSGKLWRQRIAMVATFHWIRQGEYSPTLHLAEKFLNHPHDLLHKASGWMLREVGKRDQAVLETFLQQHCSEMPRTMLRYSIERLPEPLRQTYLKRPVH